MILLQVKIMAFKFGTTNWEVTESSNSDEAGCKVTDLIYIINKNAEKADIIKEQISIHKWNEKGENSLEIFTKDVLEVPTHRFNDQTNRRADCRYLV